MKYLAALLCWLSPALVMLCRPACAREAKVPEAAAPVEVKPGAVALLKAAAPEAKGMRYFLRVPRSYNVKNGARLVVFMHGSSMNGLEYLRSFESKRWCADDILCCPNGEQGGDPLGQNNFSFESGPLVAAVTQEVQKAFKITQTYIGGHSQGGFLTYSVILNFPELFQGALPMAGDCWMQNEPNLWEEKPEVLRRQMEIPIAVIHGRADPVVAFSQGEHAYDCFRAMGWTKLRLFAPEKLGHQFMLSPVEEALEWLDAVNGLNERKSVTLAAKWAREGEWGWVAHAAKASKISGPNMLKQAEAAAAKAVPAMTEAMKGKPEEWIPKWTEFRRIFGETEAARPLVDSYLAQRKEQRAAAGQLFNEAQGLFRSDKRADALKVLEKLRSEGASTYQGYFAWKWLKEKK